MKKKLRLFIFCFIALAVFTLFPNMHVSADEQFVSDDGFIYELTSKSNKFVTVIGYEGKAANVVIPEKYGDYYVVYIGKSAFEGNTNIESVVIPASIRMIYEKAFYNCTKLKSVVFEPGEKAWWTEHYPSFSSNTRTLYKLAFGNCVSLEYIEIPENLDQSFPDARDGRVFEGSGLKKADVILTSGWTHIGPMFNGCQYLKEINLNYSADFDSAYSDQYLYRLADLPALERINIDNAYFYVGFSNTMLDASKDTTGKNILTLPALKEINLYFYELTVPGRTVSARGDFGLTHGMFAFECSDSSLFEFIMPQNDNSMLYIKKLLKNGTATFTSTNGTVPFVINVTVSSPEPKKQLSEAKVELPLDQFIHTGEEIIPYAILTHDGTILKENTDYTVSCKDNKDIGKAVITFTGKGDYEGSVNAEYTIIPVTVAFRSVVKSSGKYTLEWNKNPLATGYQVYYSKKKGSGYKKLVSTEKLSASSNKLKSGMFIKIRTYTKVNGQTYYSAWSSPITVK